MNYHTDIANLTALLTRIAVALETIAARQPQPIYIQPQPPVTYPPPTTTPWSTDIPLPYTVACGSCEQP